MENNSCPTDMKYINPYHGSGSNTANINSSNHRQALSVHKCNNLFSKWVANWIKGTYK